MRRSNAHLNEEVAALGDLPREDLAALWEKAHGHPPPKGIRQELLLRSASWHLQAKRLGGLRPNTRRLLKIAMDAENSLRARASVRPSSHIDIARQAQSVEGVAQGASDESTALAMAKGRRGSVSPGARLVRDWNGKTYVVDVIEEGFVFQAKVHKSLTAIAHQITGAHWSGPRFFGL